MIVPEEDGAAPVDEPVADEGGPVDERVVTPTPSPSRQNGAASSEAALTAAASVRMQALAAQLAAVTVLDAELKSKTTVITNVKQELKQVEATKNMAAEALKTPLDEPAFDSHVLTIRSSNAAHQRLEALVKTFETEAASIQKKLNDSRAGLAAELRLLKTEVAAIADGLHELETKLEAISVSASRKGKEKKRV